MLEIQKYDILNVFKCVCVIKSDRCAEVQPTGMIDNFQNVSSRHLRSLNGIGKNINATNLKISNY